MPSLYLCFRGDTARYTLLAETDDTAEGIWLSEMVEEELRRRRPKVVQPRWVRAL